VTLIDGGWATDESLELLARALDSIGYGLEHVTEFLVTHMHRDHYTQAVAVRRELGTHVSLGIGERASLELLQETGADVDPQVAKLRRAGGERLVEGWTRVTGRSRPPLDLYAPPDSWLADDHTIEVGDRALEAVATPGHTQGHVVFADLAAGLLFAGDHVLPTITPSIGFEPVHATLPLGDFLSSLAKVRALPDLVLLPAHGPAGGASHARVDELVAHHEHRLHLCLQAVESGLCTAYAVAGVLPWTRRERALRDLDPFNAGLATTETLAHLELLAAQGRVIRQEHDGVAWFARMAAPPAG
jgi:glyoxylase-like metal-dependent hydrolase (beta-lactamase superfamily II)